MAVVDPQLRYGVERLRIMIVRDAGLVPATSIPSSS